MNTPPDPDSSAPAIRASGLSKRFGGIPALSDVSVRIDAGTIHALVGQNGAGKSTLGKLIAGVYPRDSGSMEVFGRAVQYRSPHDAIKDGIVAIQQEIALVPGRTALENVFLGGENSRLGWVNTRILKDRYDSLREITGFQVRPDAVVGNLRIADQQKVEIMRALARDARILVLDEPTAALTPDESAQLLAIATDLRNRGVTVIYVSHFLKEVLQLADAITVLRNGRVVETLPVRDTDEKSLIRLMLDRDLHQAFPEKSPQIATKESEAPLLTVTNLCSGALVSGVSFSVRPGEIVGIAGLVGSGRSETLRTLFGDLPITGGEIQMSGTTISKCSPHASVSTGVGFIPESRKDQGLFLNRSVRFNSSIAHLPVVSKLSWVLRRGESHRCSTVISRLGITPASTETMTGKLSGGNQQKVLFARWLFEQPRILLIDEPTRGVDVGAKYSIYEEIFRLASEGIGVVLVSSELEEVMELSDHVVVMHRGSMVLSKPRSEINQDRVMRAAFGADGKDE